MRITESMYLSAVKGRRTLRALFRKEKEKNWIPDNRQSDVRCVVGLILEDDKGNLGHITSGMAAAFENNTNTFNFKVRYKDGSVMRVVVTMSECSDVEPLFTPPASQCG